ncbi:ATP-dependent nuclease [Arthrobacter castelli]|uniref:ATP-dependent nuclease n=1 Tax=Arthrobacter castelli TaxID=271431 RepID=UPI0004212E41|nr:AAA family ATPase [Arthrobacter castelli]
MRLTAFRVRKFRNIIDSGEITVDEMVTCLVGMNESGKTAILSALHRLNPVDGDEFDEQRDYPRWLLSRDRREETIDAVEPITATFALEDEDVDALTAFLGKGVVSANTVAKVSQRYNTERQQWNIPHDKAHAVRNLLDRAEVRKKTTERFKAVEDLDGIEAVCAKLIEDGNDPQTEKTAEEVTAIRAELKKLGGGTTSRVALNLLKSRLPKFFYFSDYSRLDGRIDITALAEADTEIGSSPSQTARALLRLARTTPAALNDEDYEDRKAELEAVGNELTTEVFKYWRQNENLVVQFDIDRKIEQTQPNRHTVTRTSLDIRVQDRRHMFTNNFSQRSAGFRWFFSFLAAFTEFERRKEPMVVLLDEPGLTLHARAQGDLIRFLNERLATVAQVLYSTHSPFMVETDRIARTRIVEDGGPETGATVTQEVLTVGESSLFPLQAALGYDIAQHLFIGDANLLVEGSSDFVFLDTLSRMLRDRDRTGLDSHWQILTAGGASNIPAFVALMGRNLEVTVLIDSGVEGADRLEKATSAARLQQRRIVQANELTDHKQADIEDLFEIEDYLKLFNRAFETTTSADDLGYGDRIVKRLADIHGGYSHHRPADMLLRNPELRDQLSDETLARFEQLFERINGTLA